MVKYIMLLAALALAGCSGSKVSKEKLQSQVEAPEIITHTRFNELVNMTPPAGPLIPIAVYKFADMTGQRKPSTSFASLSSAVTQGAEVILLKALQDAGHGKWFQPVERVGLDNLVKERQLIRSQRELYEKDQAKPLTPLIVAGVMIDGGIVGYDTDLGTGGIGARFLGIGADQQYRKDQVTVALRAVSTNTGEILMNVQVSKTILSVGRDISLFRFVDVGTKLIEAESGMTQNEANTIAVKTAIEQAVIELIKQGIEKGYWKYQE